MPILSLNFLILQKRKDLWNELAKSIFGYSDYTLQALYFYALLATGGFIPLSKREHYIRRGKELRQKILDKLKTNGVFFYPTFPQSAMRHNESVLKLSGVMYSMIWNIMGFPSTHVPVSAKLKFHGRIFNFFMRRYDRWVRTTMGCQLDSR